MLSFAYSHPEGYDLVMVRCMFVGWLAVLSLGFYTSSFAADAVVTASQAPLQLLKSAQQHLEKSTFPEAYQQAQSAQEQYPLVRDIALHYQAKALRGMGRLREAAAAARQAADQTTRPGRRQTLLLLNAELLLADNALQEALTAYQQFVHLNTTSPMLATARLNIARCQQALKDYPAAAKTLKELYLQQPTHAEAQTAYQLLLQLESEQPTAIIPISDSERLERAERLVQANKAQAALETITPVTGTSFTAEQKARYALLMAKIQFKKRSYSQVSLQLKEILAGQLPPAARDEAQLLLGKAELRQNRDNEALALLRAMAAERGKAVDKALFDAALIHKTNTRPQEARILLERILREHPHSSLKTRVLWELAWAYYQAKSYQEAEVSLTKLLSFHDERERALYWLIRSLELQKKDASHLHALLLKEFPFGFYAAWHRQQHNLQPDWHIATEAPPPVSYPEPLQRAALLIEAGLPQEAAFDLRDMKTDPMTRGLAPPLAYLQGRVGDHLGSIATFHQFRPDTISPANSSFWEAGYPRPYYDLFRQHATGNRLSEALVLSLAKQESRFRPAVRSHAGAIGLMQLMPATARQTARLKEHQFSVSMLSDPTFNISIGTKHLRELSTQYNNNTVFILAAYNAGASAVNRWRAQFGTLPLDEFVESIPYQETRDYVKKIVASIPVYQTLYRIP